MSTKQVESSDSGSDELILTSFQVERVKWERFETLAKSQHRSRGAQIRELIDRALDEHDHEQTRAA